MEPQAQEKSLLIIKSNPRALGPAESFLKNREWKIKSTANLQEALIYLVQNQPKFVMISIDHPNRKVRNLPKVLSQAFPVCVIAFCESSSAANLKSLSETSKYAIFPPITGPAIERTVNKYYKDLQTKESTAGSGGEWEGSDEQRSAMIAIKGGGLSSTESAQNLLAKLLGADAESMLSGPGSQGVVSGTIVNSNDANGNNGFASTGVSSSGNNGFTSTGGSTNGNGGFAATGVSSSENSANSSGMQGRAMSSQGGSSQDGSGFYMNPPMQEDTDMPYTPRAKSGGGWAPLPDSKKSSKQKPGPEAQDPRAVNHGEDSLMAKGSQEALEKSCINLVDKVEELQKATNVACILVDSTRFSGYLVAAMAKDRHVDTVFIEKIRTRLFRFLRENGEKVEDADSMSIKIKEVPFEDWALDHADFLRKSVHNGEEIAMAFFPYAKPNATFLECDDAEMAVISIDELIADTPLEFNLYIHLPKNDRYLLYTPCGGVFFSNQKERLVNQGVQRLHILRLELGGLNKYRAQNFLNEKVEEFQEKEALLKKTAKLKQSV